MVTRFTHRCIGVHFRLLGTVACLRVHLSWFPAAIWIQQGKPSDPDLHDQCLGSTLLSINSTRNTLGLHAHGAVQRDLKEGST